jgi:hypothetical protein
VVGSIVISAFGTFPTWRGGLAMSVHRGRPGVATSTKPNALRQPVSRYLRALAIDRGAALWFDMPPEKMPFVLVVHERHSCKKYNPES